MYLHQLILKNIRGFSDLEFNFKRDDGSYAGWTVFTGDNGSGKSTLLKAIAIGLTGRDVARSLQPSFHRWRRDGYRAALALLSDILRHLINAYGVQGLTERDGEGKLRVVRSGIVLIDEIDAHLHPEWQREIGF